MPLKFNSVKLLAGFAPQPPPLSPFSPTSGLHNLSTEPLPFKFLLCEMIGRSLAASVHPHVQLHAFTSVRRLKSLLFMAEFVDYGNKKTPSMHCRLSSLTLSQLAFPGESDSNFLWEKSHWNYTVVKKKKKSKKLLRLLWLFTGSGVSCRQAGVWCTIFPFGHSLSFCVPLFFFFIYLSFREKITAQLMVVFSGPVCTNQGQLQRGVP